MIKISYNKNTLKNLNKKIQEKYDIYYNKKFNTPYKQFVISLKDWERGLKLKLSDQLPKHLWHSLRDPSRLFPHKNTGRQVRSLKSDAKITFNKIRGITIKSWAEIGVPYAAETDKGLPPRRDGIIPNWTFWATDTFFADGRGGIRSVTDIFYDLIDDMSLLARGI